MRCAMVGLLLGLVSLAGAAEESSLGLSYVKTKDLWLIYFDNLSYLEPHVVRTFVNSFEWQRKTFGWVPSQPTTVLLKDFSDYGNAAAAPVPGNRIIVDVAPTSHAFETNPASERMYSAMNHELVHIATTDLSSQQDQWWRHLLFGKVLAQAQYPESILYSYLTVPRFTTPRWYLEGSAVFMETWMSGGLGRAQGGYDEMVFRAIVRDQAPFFDPLALESSGTRVDFQVGANAYLYGTRFFTWLAYAHSPNKVITWLKRDEDSKRDYAENFQHVFGISLAQGWQNWITFEREFQQKNLIEIRKNPITRQSNLSAGAVGSISRAFYDEASGILYGALRYPGVVEHVAAINTRDGSVRRIADIKRAMLYRVAAFAYDPNSGTAFYTNDNLAQRDLMAVNVSTGEEKMLLEDARIGEIVFNRADRSLLGVRHADGLASLVQIPFPYDHWTEIYKFPYESVPSDLDISPDSRLLSASMSEVSSEQFLRVWEIDKLLLGDVKPFKEFRFGQSVPESFVFSPDGRYLFGSSYYTGVSNIFRYELATGEVEAVSNAESGLFRPIPLTDGRIIVFSYTGRGFVPAIIDARPIKDVSASRFLGAELVVKYPEIKTWQVPPPSTVNYDQQITARGIYNPLHEISPINAYPVLQGYKNSVGVGYHFNMEDPLSFASLGITIAHTPDQRLGKDEAGHLDIFGRYLGWHGGLSWNRSDFYDLFGPTVRSRKGLAAKLGHDETLIYDEPRKLELRSDIAYYDKIDKLPGFQKIDAGFSRLITGELGMHYTNVRRSLGAVDDEKGLNWATILLVNRANRQSTAQLRGGLDIGFALPWAHSSIWSYSAVGIANGDRDNPVTNFYFGGFGNNYVDHGTIKRFREYDSMPGFGLNEIKALNFLKETVELNLPPTIFESVGTPRFHLVWLRPSLFVSAISTDLNSRARQKLFSSLGGQIDLRFSVLHWYDMTLSLGYATAYRESQRAGTQAMISLKIM